MTPSSQSCLDCGAIFECGMGNDEPCWCSVDFPALMPLPEGARGCYCPACLAVRIAAASDAKAI